jgi:hypothetical protein
LRSISQAASPKATRAREVRLKPPAVGLHCLLGGVATLLLLDLLVGSVPEHIGLGVTDRISAMGIGDLLSLLGEGAY